MNDYKVTTQFEDVRGCGFRAAGQTGVGKYLMGGRGIETDCERLPYPLTVCPCCGEGIKMSRSWTKIQAARLFDPVHSPACTNRPECGNCPICRPHRVGDPAYLLWIGARSYSPAAFVDEAMRMGVSRRINAIPREFRIGETWVFLAHPRGLAASSFGADQQATAAVIGVFKPTHVDLVIDNADAIPKEAKNLVDSHGPEHVRIVVVNKNIQEQGELL